MVFVLIMRGPPRSTLFPYAPLFLCNAVAVGVQTVGVGFAGVAQAVGVGVFLPVREAVTIGVHPQRVGLRGILATVLVEVFYAVQQAISVGVRVVGIGVGDVALAVVQDAVAARV